MRIIKAKALGLCKGGKDSIEGAQALARDGKKVYVFGNLLHNPRVISDLEKQGIICIEPNPDIQVSGKLVIRAHGVSDSMMEQLKQKNELVDLTCPKVKAIQKLSKSYEKKGFHVLYLGKQGHPEALATVGNLRNFTLITGLEDIKILDYEKLVFLAQSTASLREFTRIAEYIKDKKPDSKIINTICSSSIERQNGAEELAKKVKLMIVLGGKESSNTKELFEICRKITNTIWIENAEEILNSLETVKQAKSIGITAGASTLNGEVDELVRIIKQGSSPSIKQIGDERYMVQSDSEPDECYEVDLAMPFCECRGFYYNKKECKHIKLARDSKRGK